MPEGRHEYCVYGPQLYDFCNNRKLINSDRAEMVFPIGSKIVAQMRAGKFPGTGDGDKMSPFEWTFSMSPWEYYRAYPEQRITFDAYMAARRDGLRPKWFEVYPARRELCPAPHEGDTKATTLVDVGDNTGVIS